VKTDIRIREARAGLPELVLERGSARAVLSLQGAQLTEYAPDGLRNLLWMSRSAQFATGRALRGGIPLCWPWFGANPDRSDRPQHGFARTRRFDLLSQHSGRHEAAVVLALDAAADFPEWHHAARLEVEIRLADHLWMELRTTNLSDRVLPIGVGLHSYFDVSSAAQVTIPALTGLDYLDKPSGFARRTQSRPLVVEGEIDRVYLDPPAAVALIDPAREGVLEIHAWGNTDLVVWNPGPGVAKAMPDFDDEAYLDMLCIEPALALGNRRHLAPGEKFAVGQTLRWLPD
jgi:D-hexose-6-phosphate mutarotase